MTIVRIIGGFLLALALAVLAIDGRAALAGGGTFHFQALGELWYHLSPATLNMLQAGVQRRLAPWLWDDVIQALLLQPAALVLAVLGAAVLAAGLLLRRRA